MTKMTLPKLNRDFDTDTECRQRLEELRWPNGIECPRCQSKKISRITTRKQYDCDSCRYRFSVTVGTIFADSHLPLPKWFLATYLMTESKKGISALQMKRMIGGGYQTAWYLCHRIRAAMTEANPEPLTGTVEVDETYIGGKRRGHGRGRGNYLANKTMILAALQRGGKIRLTTGPTNNRKTLHGFIKKTVCESAENIYTDAYQAYRGIGDENTKHEYVSHQDNEWVRGDVHTNSVEGAFGLFKRAIVGSFHQISTKHIDRYLDEFEFRFNNRKNPYLFRDTLIRLLEAKTLPYEKLTQSA
jgi:transposase-like protein